MINIFKIQIIALFFVISGCSWLNHQIWPYFPDSNHFINNFGGNHKGIIIFKFSSKYPSSNWCKYNKNKIQEEQNICLELKTANYYQILMADPGFYEITSYEDTTKSYRKRKIIQRTKNEIRISQPKLAFEIKENKINFIENFNYKSSQDNKNQQQDFENIKTLFADQDIKALEKIFKGHKYEVKILNDKILGNKKVIDQFFIKDNLKTSKFFKETTKKLKKTKKTKKSNNKNNSKFRSKYEN